MGESVLAHHFICENEKNTPVRHYQNEKVSGLSGCSPKAPSLGHKEGDFLSPFQPYFLTLIWVKTQWLRQHIGIQKSSKVVKNIYKHTLDLSDQNGSTESWPRAEFEPRNTKMSGDI